MKTDRELLELAAKAAGVCLSWRDDGGPFFAAGYGYAPRDGRWNPLTDDGDALRLAVKVGIMVAPPAFNGGFEATASAKAEGIGWIDEIRGFSNEAATRRAIVRAAAAIGEQIP